MTYLAVVFLLLVFIFWIIEEISKSNRNSKHKKQIEEKWSHRKIEEDLDLEERNEDIIQNHLSRLSDGYHRSYYIDNSVRDCIQDICEAEGQIDIAPKYQYLSNWVNTAPQEYQDLKDSLLSRFRLHHEDIVARKTAEENIKAKKEFETLQVKYKDLIKQFYDVTERKVSILDEYGDESWDELEKQIKLVLTKIMDKEGNRYPSYNMKTDTIHSYFLPEQYKLLVKSLEESFKEFHKLNKHVTLNKVDFSKMTGVDFETYIGKLLKQNGYSNVSGTPTTGDQGADLIAYKNDKKIIIQAKCYTGTVGNKAVQEVVSALSYYGGDEGWVITNALFTKSAKELAQKTKTRLIDGNDLLRFSS